MSKIALSKKNLFLFQIQDYFVSCGKDQSVCLWKFEGLNVKLVGKGTGHSSYVGAVAMSTELLFSASKDGVLKSWTIPEDPSDPTEVQSLKTKRTVAAHQVWSLTQLFHVSFLQ